MTTKLTDFDIQKFNLDFDIDKDLQTQKSKAISDMRLSALNNQKPPEKKIYELSVGEILIGIKDTWFDILDDILQRQISFDIITKNNRLFYIGLTIVIIALIIYLYELLIEDDMPDNSNKQEIKKYYFYHANDDKNKKTELQQEIKRADDNVIILEKPDYSDSSDGNNNVN
jgi:hypothetical protein